MINRKVNTTFNTHENSAAFLKMASANSIILRIYSLMRILHENLDYSFILGKEMRKPRKGLFYYPIKKIINPELKIMYNEDDIDLKGTEKTKYCREKVYDVLIKLLEENGYIFNKIKTNTATLGHGKDKQYPPITIQKLKSFTIECLGHVTFCNMSDVENSIGLNTYEHMQNIFIKQFSVKECIICRDYKLSSICRECTMTYYHLIFPINNGLIENTFVNNEVIEDAFVNNINEEQIITPLTNIPTEYIDTINNTYHLYNEETQLCIEENIVLRENDNPCYEENDKTNNFEVTTFINYTNCDSSSDMMNDNDVNLVNENIGEIGFDLQINENEINIMVGFNLSDICYMDFDPYVDEHILKPN